LLASRSASSAKCAYLCVVAICVCPISFPTIWRLAPLLTR
jgi:hypothetical protein